MAKWGEGDARWIVEEREDGTNADNWHWTEKKATAWSEGVLKTLLPNLATEDGKGNSCQTTEVDSIEGDVIANCRKGKLIFFYEVVIKMKWKGETADGTKVNGTLTIPNLSEEQDIDDIDVNVKLTSDETPERRKVKDLMRKKGADLIRVQLEKWLKQLKEEYAVDLVKPTGKSATPGGATGPAKVAAETKKAEAKKSSGGGDTSAVPTKSKEAKFVSFSLSEEFSCTPMDLFQAICTEDRVRAYTQSDCKIDAKVGGEFTMFSGNVQGVFESLEPGKLIKQAWRFKHWTAGHFSTVTLKITDKGGKCQLDLHQEGVPEAEAESTKAGWKANQWTRMKAILGFGPGLGFSF
eukprot:m.312994 g.312994  ORF g.312994 m.312994 type:complete len:351 (-) comp20250_c0_seq1:244-1296(-)